jgi:hypothetical protein
MSEAEHLSATFPQVVQVVNGKRIVNYDSNRLRVHMWRDLIDVTKPGDTWSTHDAGELHARLMVPIPIWLARVVSKVQWRLRRKVKR